VCWGRGEGRGGGGPNHAGQVERSSPVAPLNVRQAVRIRTLGSCSGWGPSWGDQAPPMANSSPFPRLPTRKLSRCLRDGQPLDSDWKYRLYKRQGRQTQPLLRLHGGEPKVKADIKGRTHVNHMVCVGGGVGGEGGGWIWIMLQPAFLVIICSGIVVLKRLLAWYWVEVGIYMVPSFVK
jgi:hypothetical protein